MRNKNTSYRRHAAAREGAEKNYLECLYEKGVCIMKAKLMITLAVALMLAGCAGVEKPRINTVDDNTFFIEVEEFDLTNAKVLDTEDASGGKSVVIQDASGKAETTIQLSKGTYEISVYALGPSYDEDAFFMTIGGMEQRMWLESPEEILPTLEYFAYTQEADGPCSIKLTYAEPNVELDRVLFKKVQ
ncbi:MAG: hypothetical protein JW715_12820 [Sedimentisphaerales bacterium]|nr:hypothetical protein [Sedimentisphaerales bacterium]